MSFIPVMRTFNFIQSNTFYWIKNTVKIKIIIKLKIIIKIKKVFLFEYIVRCNLFRLCEAGFSLIKKKHFTGLKIQ